MQQSMDGSVLTPARGSAAADKTILSVPGCLLFSAPKRGAKAYDDSSQK
jgi:hypothetical protein